MSTQSPFRETASLTLVEETAIESGDLVFTTEQIKNMDSKKLRQFAAHAKSDAVNGKSTRLEQENFFARQRTLNDF